MNTTKKLCFCLLFLSFFAFLPLAHASAEGGRYFVRSTKGFWKNALGVRHEFDNGFSADISDFQARLAKVFGVDIEPVSLLQILPSDSELLPASSIVAADSSTPVPSPATVKKPKTLRRGGVIRYLPSDQTPWGIETIYNDPSIASASGGFGVNVVVLDTGVNILHPDLSRRIAQCKDFTNPRYPVLDNKCDDKNGHGTHVAGIIAADSGSDHLGIYGVAPSAKIFAYKVCGANGSCYADDIAAGLRMAADQTDASRVNVVNMSFGTDEDVQLIRDAVDYASSRGVLLVAAAGNDGPLQGTIDYPGAYASVVAVGAIDQLLSITDWSSRGINSQTAPYTIEKRDIEFAAPGNYIESTWNNGGYAILSGTSMASPFIAGLAAKYWQLSVTDPSQTTRDFLHSLAPNQRVDNDASGFGLPQVK